MKKAIIIIVAIIVLAALGAGAFLFLQSRSSLTTGTPVQNGTGMLPLANGGAGAPFGGSILLGDATVSSTDITPGIPAGAPQGATISFQTASGTITLKNFYNDAQGYWAPLDALLLQHNASYTTWYYRDTSEFTIVLPVDGTMSDADAAAMQLAGDLGVSEQKLCSLPVSAVFMIDRSMDSQIYPFDFCSTQL